MTKALTRKLERGVEVYNTQTGEVARFTAAIGSVGETVYIESMDHNGRFHIWPHKQTECV